MAHPAMKKIILDTAKEDHIPIQLAAEVGNWTTDAAAIHCSENGSPTGFISIPRRYAHSPAEVLDIKDGLLAVSLLKGVVNRLANHRLSFI